MRSTKAKLLSFFLIASTSLSPVAPALAQNATQRNLTAVGPISPQTNFPVYYQDHTGLALELCTAKNDQLGMCIYDPIDPADTETLTYQNQIGFNAEAFWWIGEAEVAMPASPECGECETAELTLAVEAAFNQERPVKGDEFMFGRIRMRIDAPYAGTYRVTHPFGSKDFVVTAPGRRAINETVDIGTMAPDPSGPLRSGIMSFLRWDPAVAPAAPQGYIGDPAQAHAVIGSPLGTNYFEIEYLGDRPLGPNGPVVRQNQFSISGRIFNGVTPTPLVVDRASNSESESKNRAEVFARSAPTATLSVRFDGEEEPRAMVGDGGGNFWYSVEDRKPELAQVTANNAGNTQTQINAPVSDIVDITEATYDPATKQLSVAAKSSVSSAVLKMVGFNEQVVGYLEDTTIDALVPPATVRVKSSLGGADEEPVVILGSGGSGPEDPDGKPTATPDTMQIAAGTTVTINVAANDSATGGASVDPSTVSITVPPQKGTIGTISEAGVSYTPNADFTSGSDTFQYRISDSQGRVSAAGTVTITIAGGTGPGGQTGTPPTAVNDPNVTTVAGTAVTIDVAANDQAFDGATIDRSKVSIATAPAKGTISLIGLSGVTYLPNAGFTSGTDTFQYKISDSQGRVSAAGTVTITIVSETLTMTDATYRSGTLSWTIAGTSNARFDNTVSAYYVSGTTRTLIGSGPVDGTGAFDIRVDRSAVFPRTGGTITLVSSKGTELSGQPITIRR